MGRMPLLASIVAAGLLAAFGGIGSAAAQEAPSPPRTYEGEIEVVSDLCGGGTISVETDGETTYVASISFDGFNVTGSGVTSLPLAGDATFEPNTVPIREDGSFDNAYFPTPYPGQLEISVTGTFDGDELTGFISFSTSPVCSPVRYSAALVEQATPSISLPTSGSGPDDGTRRAHWAALVLVAGAGFLGGGLLVRRRFA